MKLSELHQQVVATQEQVAKIVYVDGDAVVIHAGVEYRVATARCNTPEKLLHWIHHLTEKTWMTNVIMRRFIELACEQGNIKMENA